MALHSADNVGPFQIADGGKYTRKPAESIEERKKETAQSLEEGTKNTGGVGTVKSETPAKPNAFIPSQQVINEIENEFQCVDIKDDGDDSINITNSTIQTETWADKQKEKLEALKEQAKVRTKEELEEQIKALTTEELEAREEQVKEKIAQLQGKLADIEKVDEQLKEKYPEYIGGTMQMTIRKSSIINALQQANTEQKLIREEFFMREVDKDDATVQALEARLEDAKQREREANDKLLEAQSPIEHSKAQLETLNATMARVMAEREFNSAKDKLDQFEELYKTYKSYMQESKLEWYDQDAKTYDPKTTPTLDKLISRLEDAKQREQEANEKYYKAETKFEKYVAEEELRYFATMRIKAQEALDEAQITPFEAQITPFEAQIIQEQRQRELMDLTGE